MAAIFFMRIKSGLDAEEFERRLLGRQPRFAGFHRVAEAS
jgi:hypothetical protein